MFRALFRRLLLDRGGNAMVMGAIAIIPLIALVGGGLDLSVAYMARAKMQNACDAAVLAGRQSMKGNVFATADRNEAIKFFEFNFPEGTHDTTDLQFEIEQDSGDPSKLAGSASARVPTSLMRVFNYENIDIAVNCDAKRNQGHNDVMLVLDVTGSMAYPASSGTGIKIDRLRTGAIGLYRALGTDNDSITRYGIVPYSHTVNIARSMKNKDVLRIQEYIGTKRVCTGSGRRRRCWDEFGAKSVHINDSTWGGHGTESGNTEAFRTSGNGCIEERPSIGAAMSPFEIYDEISREDVDTLAGNAGNDRELQFGRYDPAIQEGESQSGCPAEATKLQTYSSESAFQGAINSATARVTGGTYHDVGMLWGTRFISRTGFFEGDNPTSRDGAPVNMHIVFMTDGMLDTGSTLYSSHGVEAYQNRTQGSGSQDDKHLSRFQSVCSLAKSMGITVWVIALDVGSTDDIEPCATSSSHFYISDGSDLQDIFSKIGKGIGNLRLTR